MLRYLVHRAKETISTTFGRIPIYVIDSDGNISQEWVNPHKTHSRAYDLEQNSSHQVFLQGYANPVDIQPDSFTSGEIDLISSSRYKTFMEQDILSQAMTSGTKTTETIKYFTMANIGLTILVIIIVLSMI